MVLFRDMGDQGQQQREARTTQEGQELQRWLSKPWRGGHASGHTLRAAKGRCSPCSCQPEEEKRCIFKSFLNLLDICGCSTHPSLSLVKPKESTSYPPHTGVVFSRSLVE